MGKTRDEKVQDLLQMKEDLQAIQVDLSGNFPSHDLENLALTQARHLIETLDTAIELHGMKHSERTVMEIRRSRGQ